MTTKRTQNLAWASGIAAALALAVIGWTAKSFMAMRDDIRDLKSQRVSAAKFWRLHQWARDEINEMRTRDGLPMAKWPELKDEDER